MMTIVCPKCGKVITPMDDKDIRTFNRLKNLGKMEMLYWKYKHRC